MPYLLKGTPRVSANSGFADNDVAMATAVLAGIRLPSGGVLQGNTGSELKTNQSREEAREAAPSTAPPSEQLKGKGKSQAETGPAGH